MNEIDSERALAEHLHEAEKQGLSAKGKVITEKADLQLLKTMTIPNEDWIKNTPDLENHIDGKTSVSPLWKNCEDRILPPEK